jgi:tRNA threonylcarbamoyladenosine biosynthesis protein TsaE
MDFLSKSSEETEEIGRRIAREHLKQGDVLCLTGDLGAGKTTLTKGIIQELTGSAKDAIVSPTFTYLNIYSGLSTVYHFDLYRLCCQEEFLEAGFDEFLNEEAICCIEWPDKLPETLQIKKKFIHIYYLSQTERKIILSDTEVS